MSESTKAEKATLSTGQYFIELSNGPSQVYKKETLGPKVWVCSAADPQTAMTIIEGLILVEQKRFYYPESKPSITSGVKTSGEEN
jgi:hypothetical protein